MRGLPVIALMAGEAISKVTNSQNIIEERLLGADEAVVLQAPPTTTHTTTRNLGRTGVSMMCNSCGMKMDGISMLPASEVLKAQSVFTVGTKKWKSINNIGDTII
jgi:hypothetical protein